MKYRAGVHNVAAEALSRRDGTVELNNISVPIWLELEGVNQAVQEDPLLQHVMKRLRQYEGTVGSYSLVNGRLLHNGRLVLPKGSKCVSTVLEECHLTPTGGHSGALRTLKCVSGISIGLA